MAEPRRQYRRAVTVAYETDEAADWRYEALCAQVDAELMFPEKGGTTRPAKKLCRRCPVIDECLEYALANGERFGIWGGKSERERRALERGRAA